MNSLEKCANKMRMRLFESSLNYGWITWNLYFTTYGALKSRRQKLLWWKFKNSVPFHEHAFNPGPENAHDQNKREKKRRENRANGCGSRAPLKLNENSSFWRCVTHSLQLPLSQPSTFNASLKHNVCSMFSVWI